ncbi:hypothetical protein YC2023_041368 [Brassica napus]
MKEPKPILNGPRSCSKTEEVFPKMKQKQLRNSCDSFACFKDNGFVLSCSKHKLAMSDLFSSTCALKDFMHTELKPAEVTKDKLNLLSDTSLELDKLSDTNLELDELSDANLDQDELSDTEKVVGLGAGRNEPFQPKKKFTTSLLWNCVLPSPSILLQTIISAFRGIRER